MKIKREDIEELCNDELAFCIRRGKQDKGGNAQFSAEIRGSNVGLFYLFSKAAELDPGAKELIMAISKWMQYWDEHN